MSAQNILIFYDYIPSENIDFYASAMYVCTKEIDFPRLYTLRYNWFLRQCDVCLHKINSFSTIMYPRIQLISTAVSCILAQNKWFSTIMYSRIHFTKNALLNWITFYWLIKLHKFTIKGLKKTILSFTFLKFTMGTRGWQIYTKIYKLPLKRLFKTVELGPPGGMGSRFSIKKSVSSRKIPILPQFWLPWNFWNICNVWNVWRHLLPRWHKESFVLSIYVNIVLFSTQRFFCFQAFM